MLDQAIEDETIFDMTVRATTNSIRDNGHAAQFSVKSLSIPLGSVLLTDEVVIFQPLQIIVVRSS